MKKNLLIRLFLQVLIFFVFSQSVLAISIDELKDTILDTKSESIDIGKEAKVLSSPFEDPSFLEAIDPQRYILDTGDIFEINIYGNILEEYKLAVTPEGKIFIPGTEPVPARGISLAEFIKKMKKIVAKYYKGQEVFVTLIKARRYKIEVSGEVNQPGTYVVSPFYGVSDVIRLAGGINRVGSYFNIKIKENNGREKTFNLFEVMMLGRADNDIILSSGDVIFVPAREGTITAKGQLRHPGDYDYPKDSTIGDFIKMIGGVNSSAALKEAWLERRDGSLESEIIKLDLTKKEFFDVKLKPNDILVVPDIALFQERIIISGEFQNPDVYSNKTLLENKAAESQGFYKKWFYILKKGERVLDVVKRSGGLTERANLYAAQINRKDAKGKIEVIPVNLYALMFSNDETQNIELKPGDEFMVPLLVDRVFVMGQVKNSGAFPYIGGKSLKEYLAMSGGPQDYANLSSVKIIRGDINNPQIFNVNLGGMFGRYGKGRDVSIKPGDIIYVPKASIISYLDVINIIRDLINVYALKWIFQ